MTEIWILTSSFPYPPGEQFLETEIEYWGQLCPEKINLIPFQGTGIPRYVPPNISVDTCVSSKFDLAKKLEFLTKSFFSDFFWQELKWLRENNKLSIGSAWIAWKTSASTLFYSQVMRKKFKKAEYPVIVYSYWFDISAYAMALLRREGVINYLVARAHRFDVYEERRKYQYMPLKRQFAQDFDRIFAISKSGRSYLGERYKISDNCLAVARLGVIVNDKLSLPSPNNIVNILSVSFCVSVKRIDRIIDGIALAVQALDQKILINWTHIGDGPDKKALEENANKTLSAFHNITFQFLGHISNTAVLRYYEANQVDVFINTSESEGVPVSIMEAMSFGVPVIAPSVGGIPEIVTQENGWILSSNPTNQEIAEAICSIEHYKDDKTRKSARQMIINNYNSQKNYSNFVNFLVNQKHN